MNISLVKMANALRPAFLCLCLVCAAATGQEAVPVAAPSADAQPATDGQPTSEAMPSVEVKQLKAPEWRPYRAMLKGATAYDKYRALAPQAPFRLKLNLRKAGRDIAAVTLKVVGSDSEVGIPIASDGSFELPRLSEAGYRNAELVVNQKKAENAVGWGPFIRTPGLELDTRRLGDLRLECEIQWAIDQDEMSFVARNAFKMIGGPCNSSRFQMSFQAPRRIDSASVRTTGRKQALIVQRNGASFVAPLHDKSWPDDALIDLH